MTHKLAEGGTARSMRQPGTFKKVDPRTADKPENSIQRKENVKEYT